MERRGKSSPAHWRLCGYVNPVRSNNRMGHMWKPRTSRSWRDGPLGPRSFTATQNQDRSSFNTEPGLRSISFSAFYRIFQVPARCCAGPFCFSAFPLSPSLLCKSTFPLGEASAQTPERAGLFLFLFILSHFFYRSVTFRLGWFVVYYGHHG